MMRTTLRAGLFLSVLLVLGACDDERGTTMTDGGTTLPMDGGGTTPGMDAGTTPGTDAGVSPGTDAGTTVLPSGPVDPACVDGQYSETLPNLSTPIDGIPFTDLGSYVDNVLAARYPFGGSLVSGGRLNRDYGDDCDRIFGGGAASADAALQRLETIVHECGHFYDLDLARSFTDAAYVIQDGYILYGDRGDTTERNGDTFARSLLNTDSYSALRPPCGGSAGRGCDSYADIYLSGSPTDGTFDSGDQGFNLLHEETVQYVNGLATAYAISDTMNPLQRTSARDGILTFLWYTERYLKMARESYPSAYSRITGDAAWRELILTVWGRAWLYLEATKDIATLSIEGDQIEALVMAPELLAEIQRVRELHGCAAR